MDLKQYEIDRHYIEAFKNTLDFSGRATRNQFWAFFAGHLVIIIALGVVGGMLKLGFLAGLYSLLASVTLIAIGIRRLHDIGKGAIWVLLGLVPLANLYLLYLYTQPSDGDNAYGPAAAPRPQA